MWIPTISQTMNHKKRSDIFRRKCGHTADLRKCLVFAEGRNTEKSYLDHLKKSHCKIIPITRKGHGIARCVDFVNECAKAWDCMPRADRASYKDRWLIYDADGRADFAESIKLARQAGFKVAFSNMCIEYWFMLHFYDHDGSIVPMAGKSHSMAQINRINDFIASYNRNALTPVLPYDSGSKMVGEDFFELMLAIDPVYKKRRIELAYRRAKKIHNGKKCDGSEFRESVTNVYTLLEELGVIEEIKEDCKLYIK